MNGGEVARRPDRTPLSQRDPVALAQHFFQSGYFADTKSMSQAVVKIVAGEELGLGPMTSMNGIHIIEGKPSLSANLLGVQVKRSEKYNFRPKQVDAEIAEVEFFEDGESVGVSKFTIEQAKRAGLVRAKSGWEKYPEAMLFARALSQGIRWFCPDVTAGSPAYTPEELGADVDQSGEPVYVEAGVEVAEPQALMLDPDRVDQLMKGFEIVGPELPGVTPLDGLNVLLGSLGLDGFDPSADLREQMAKLTPEQANALDAEFQAAVSVEEVAGEVVDEEATDADA